MALPKAPEEREYGAVQEDENLDATAPPPIEPTPAQADEESLGRVEETMEEAIAPQDAVAQPEQQPRQPTTPRPSMWRIPHRYDTVLGTVKKRTQSRILDVLGGASSRMSIRASRRSQGDYGKRNGASSWWWR